MKPLTLRFLGSWGGAIQERPLQLRGRKAMALLAYLVVEGGQRHSRESLVGLLWPEMGEAQARNNLRVVLARLKRGLETISTPATPILQSNRREIWFNKDERIWLDTVEFQRLVETCQTHPHEARSTCPQCQVRLAKAVALYRGPFLAGFHLDDCLAFDEWLFVQRERLHLQVMELLEELGQGLEANGRFPEATTYTRRQLELDPLQESAQRRLVRLLAYQGQHSAALSQYQTFKTILREELGIEPDLELTQLAQQIRKRTLPIPGTQPTEQVTAVQPHNLPEALTPFFGRETELQQLAERLTSPGYRLITLVGPGGIGKTRLALEVARANLHRYQDGAFFVPLAAVERVENMATAITDALNISLRGSDQSPRQQLIQFLAAKKILVVIDNLEHLIEGVDLLLEILHRCPQVVLLVTSRHQLDVQAEDLFWLQGLATPTPDQMDQAGKFDAVRLFCDRAHRLKKSFKLTQQNRAGVAAVCRLVEGLPLALELAASWIGDFDVAELARAIGENVDILRTTMRDMAPQHRSMRAVFDYSWRLLAPDEQELLAKLSVFRGGFSLEAAAATASATRMRLTRLRYQSLIMQVSNDRYDLHELTRQLAAEKLAMMGETVETAVFDQHSHTYANLLSEQANALWGQTPNETALVIQRDIDNARMAWQWAVRRHQWPTLERAVTGLGRFLFMTGRYRDGVQLFRRALAVLEQEVAQARWTALHTDLQIELATMLCRLGRLEEAVSLTETAVQWATKRQDTRRAARACLEHGYALYQLTGNNQQAIDLHRSGIEWARQGNHRLLWALNLRFLAYAQILINQQQQAEANLKDALAIQQGLGNLMEQQSIWLQLGISRLGGYDYSTARTYLEKSLALLPAVRNPGLESRVINALGFTEAALGNFATALPLHETAYRLAQDIGELVQLSMVEGNLVTVKRKMGRLAEAEAHAQASLAVARQAESNEALGLARLHLAYVWLDQGLPAKVLPLLEGTLPNLTGLPALWVETAAALAEAHRQLGQLKAALAMVAQVAPHLLKETMFDGTDEPFQVYLNVYHTLRDVGDDRAELLLRRAHGHLQTIAAKIDDPAARRAFLENVPANREVACAWSSCENAPDQAGQDQHASVCPNVF